MRTLAPGTNKESLHAWGKRYSIKFEGVDPRRALALLARESGVEMHIPVDLLQRPIMLELRDAPFWRALDDLCRHHGNIHLGVSPPGGVLTVQHGPWTERPTWYAGPLRLQVHDVGRVRQFRYPHHVPRTELTFELRWMETFHPVTASARPGRLTLTVAEDDTGASLLPRPDGVRGKVGTPTSFRGKSMTRMFILEPASTKASRLTRIEGTWEGAWLEDFETVTFEDPLISVGTERRVGPIRLVLDRFERFPSGRCEFRILMSYDRFEASPEWKDSLLDVPLGNRLDPRVVLEGDRIMKPHLHAGTAGARSAEWKGAVRLPGMPKALVLRVANRVGAASVPFSFKDVRLPGAGR